MNLIKLTFQEFKSYVDRQSNGSFYQTEEYARFMEEENFDYDLMGIKDKYDNIRAATLIIFKHIDNKTMFGYAPRGFFIDYKDKELVNDFAKALSKYYKRRNIIFIKINPNIIISKYNKETNTYDYNDNIKFIEYLKKNKFQELKKSKYFEALIPTFSPIINLKKFAYRDLSKNVRNKINKCYRKGLSIDKGNFDSIKRIYPFLKNKTKKDITYYENLYRSFERSNSIDIFEIKIDYEEFLINTRSRYNAALERNNILNELITFDTTLKTMNRKIQSDKEMESYKKDIVNATNGLSRNKTEVIAGAIVIKYKNKVTIYASGYNTNYKDFNANDFLYYKLMEYYKYTHDFLDLNGFSGDISDTNPYNGLNAFKMGFNPEIYEDIGEFDIVFKKRIYNKIASNGTLTKLFSKLKQ